ncbi:unnamed protein product [Lactuca saligna]|uniref:Uncharacterized protein n=1 Tax=Lactuca saligna TaxID=75948 RepID=A0AA36ESA9_LACSI|nr:unnamed protein product [Lactuca saligna]
MEFKGVQEKIRAKKKKRRKGVVGGKAPPTHNGGFASHKQIDVDMDFIESRRADLELLGEEIDENELFYTVIGGHDRKRKFYGLDSYGRSIFPIDSSKTCTSPHTNSEKHHLETKIQKLEETIVQQIIGLDEVRNTINDMINVNN